MSGRPPCGRQTGGRGATERVELSQPLIFQSPVVEPLVVDEGDHRQAAPTPLFDQRMRHSAHRPEAEDIRREIVELEGQLPVVVALDRESLTRPDPCEVVVRPVPAQAAMNIGLVAVV